MCPGSIWFRTFAWRCLLRRFVAFQGLKSGCCRVLLGLLAGSAFGLRQILALDAHPAAEAFGVAVLAAAFFGCVAGQSQPLALAPLLQCCFAVELVGSGQHRLGGGTPVGGEPAVNRLKISEGAVQRSDECLGGIGPQP